MNVTNESKTTAQKSDKKSVASSRNAKRALGAVSEYVARVLAASALTMWGALNLVVSARNAVADPATPVDADGSGPWWITWLFVALTAVLPFAIGLNLFRKLYQHTKVR